MMHDTSLFKQLFSIIRLGIRERSGPGFFSFSDFFRFGSFPDHQRQELLSGGFSAHRMGCMHVHKSLYSSPAAAAVPEPSGFHREAVRSMPGFPQDSIMISSRFFSPVPRAAELQKQC